MVLGNRPFDKILKMLKFTKERAPHSQYIGSNILKMYVLYFIWRRNGNSTTQFFIYDASWTAVALQFWFCGDSDTDSSEM
jgi:hypothetical protein